MFDKIFILNAVKRLEDEINNPKIRFIGRRL